MRATAIFADPCTGAQIMLRRSGADSPRGIDHGQSDGARVPPRWSCHRGQLVAPGEPARFWKLRQTRAVTRGSCFAPLRYTAHDPQRTFQKPQGKRYRGRRDFSLTDGMIATGPSVIPWGSGRAGGVLRLSRLLRVAKKQEPRQSED